MSRKSNILLGLLLFNGLSATGGGLALMTDWRARQTEPASSNDRGNPAPLPPTAAGRA
jgi:hypothetical protein